jgi:penicillin-binding protein 2
MLAAHQRELSGVLVEPWPRRVYPAGSATTPVVGHVGLEPWAAGSGENVAGADAGHVVGRAGLELAFDSLLAGESGIRYIEMDAAGSVVIDATRTTSREPRPGQTLRARIDAALQRRVAELLPTRTSSAAVVLEIATGDVLALYSHPADLPGRAAGDTVPVNAAIARIEEPRTIFQPITAALALESGRIDVERPQAVPCRGGMRYGERYFRCWKPDGHGQLALAGAIREGCDVYFHQVSLRLGLQLLLEMGARLGLDQTTGLELREERPSRFPTTVQALGTRLGRAPNPSDGLDLGTGHALNQATLIRMTHTYAALAAGGAAPAPRLTGTVPAPAPWRMELAGEATLVLMSALDAVTAPGGPGAAAGLAMGPGTAIRGQLTRAREGESGPRRTGWFVGVAGVAGGPARIAVGVLVERAPSDATAAALAGRIADYYLRSVAQDPGPQAPDTTTPSSTTVSSL